MVTVRSQIGDLDLGLVLESLGIAIGVVDFHHKHAGNVSVGRFFAVPFACPFPPRFLTAGDVSRPYPLRFRPLAVPGTGDGCSRTFLCFRGYDSTNKVYVGNLAWSVDNLALEPLFQEQGNVMEARVVYDRDSGRSKGFGFVTYGSMDEVNKAIDSMDGLNVDGRSIRVSLAETRQRPQF